MSSCDPRVCGTLYTCAACLQGVGSSSSQSEELRVASARLLAAQGMVREGFMAGACRHGPVSGWPSPSSSAGPATASSVKKVCLLVSCMPICQLIACSAAWLVAASLLWTRSCWHSAASYLLLLLIWHAVLLKRMQPKLISLWFVCWHQGARMFLPLLILIS